MIVSIIDCCISLKILNASTLYSTIGFRCPYERSQFQNKEQCLRLLKAKLFELEMQKREQVKKGIEGEQQAIEWGSQIRSYVFQPYTLVKDNRTGIETGNIQSVMDGGLNPFIEGFLKHKKFNNA